MVARLRFPKALAVYSGAAAKRTTCMIRHPDAARRDRATIRSRRYKLPLRR